MAAIITENFRRNNARMLFDDISNTPYYIGIGQTREWDETDNETAPLAPFPSGAVADQQRVKEQLVGMFRITEADTEYMIPRNRYSAEAVYKMYDPYDPTCFYVDPSNGHQPCYVTHNDNIFLALNQYDDASSTAGDSVFPIDPTYKPIVSTNGSQIAWVYLGKFQEHNLLNSSAFVAVDNDVDTDVTHPPDHATDGTPGINYGFKVLDGGNIYQRTDGSTTGTTLVESVSAILRGIDANTSFPLATAAVIEVDVTIDNATSAIIGVNYTYDPTISPTLPFQYNIGQVELELTHQDIFDTASGVLLPLSGYTGVGVEDPQVPATDTSHASILPLVSSPIGFGANKFTTLPSWYIGAYADTAKAPYIPSGTEYRQVSLIRNATQYLYGASFVNPLPFFKLKDDVSNEMPSNNITEIGTGTVVRNANGTNYGTITYVQKIVDDASQIPLDAGDVKFYYTRDHQGGYGQIHMIGSESANALVYSPADGSEDITSPRNATGFATSGVNLTTADIVFIDNRTGIPREESQNEELKIIIQL